MQDIRPQRATEKKIEDHGEIHLCGSLFLSVALCGLN